VAIWNWEGESKVTLRSDRGGQFISGTYQKFLGSNAVACSMSAVGHCADNTACEGFFGMLMRERANRTSRRVEGGPKADMFDYLERFHNPRMRRKVARQERACLALA
jgi:putative transposase